MYKVFGDAPVTEGGLPPPLPTTTDNPTKVHPPDDQLKVIGVIICLCGNILISIAINIQKHAHNTLAGTGKPYLFNATWWFGMVLIGAGELGNFLAYGFAPASLIAPLGSSGVIVNALIAAIFLKEVVRFRDVFGIIFAIGGGYLLVVYSESDDVMLSAVQLMSYLKEYVFIGFISIELCLFVFLIILHLKEERINVVTLILQVALLGSPTVISAKAVSSLLYLTVMLKRNQLMYPILYVMFAVLVLSIIAQIRYLNKAIARYDASVVMPVYFVFFSIVAIVSGVTFYQEFWDLHLKQVLLSLVGIFMSFLGVFLISGGRQGTMKKDDEVESADEDEALLNNEVDSIFTDPFNKEDLKGKDHQSRK